MAALSSLALATQAGSAQAQGIYLLGSGAINQGMAGAGVAAPLDSAGALNSNPASISGLSRSDMQIGMGMVLPTESLSSSVGGGAFSGSTQGQPGVVPVPVMSYVQKNACSPWTWGVGVAGVGGFSANYPASTTNPVLNPALGGFGALYSNASIYQITPTISYAISDKLSIGIAPMLDLAQVQVNPLLLAPPAGAGPTYLPGTDTRYSFGAGLQAGVYYRTDRNINLGFSIRSPQWFEPLRYYQTSGTGAPITDRVNLNLPMIISWGAAYTGFERWLFASDIKYYDYASATGFNGLGYGANGALNGLGWNSIVSVQNGVQFRVNNKLMLRGGYAYFTSPISSSRESYNVVSSLFMNNFLSVGGTYLFRPNVMASLAYTHGFQTSQTGPIITPLGTVPGSSVSNTISSDHITLSMNVLF